MKNDLIRSFEMNMEHARRLLKDIDDTKMATQPIARMNHPAWIVGHLVHSFQAIAGELGLAPWLPDTWRQIFGTGTKPEIDRDFYPSKSALLAAFDDAQTRLPSVLAGMTDVDFRMPLPDQRYRHVFPTVGGATLHILTVHAATHLGQLSAWRRACGLPPVADSYCSSCQTRATVRMKGNLCRRVESE